MNNKIVNHWKCEKIENLCEVMIGGTPSRNKKEYWDNGENVWVSIRDLTNNRSKYINDSSEKITDIGVKKSNVKLIPNNTLIMSFKLSIGKVAITTKPLYTNEAIAAFKIVNKEELDTNYLYYFLPTIKFNAETAVKGATLNKEKLKRIVVSFPSLKTQQKVASILSTIDETVLKSNQIIERTQLLKDNLTKKTFNDELIKEKWPTNPLSDVAEVQRGKFSIRPRNDPRYFGGTIPFIQTGDVVGCYGVIKKYSQTLNEDGLRVSRLFKKGTIVITIAANIGDTGILSFDSCFPDSLVGITPNGDLNNIYLEYYLRSKKDYLNSISTQSAQKNINLVKLNPLPVIVPNMERQKQIADMLGSLDSKIVKEREYKDKLISLKSGLMSDIFSQRCEIK